MRFLVPQISISVLLVHLLLGCCWHHSHTCAIDCYDQPAPLAEICACGVHQRKHEEGAVSHERGQDRRPSDDGRDSQPHRCAGGDCTYLRSERLMEQDGGSYSHFFPCDPASSDSLEDQTVIAQSIQAIALVHRLFEAGPPIRRHLLLNILVI